jgi:hypothetical protein
LLKKVGGLSPSPRSSPLKRKRDFHPHPYPLPSREREIEERVFTGRGTFTLISVLSVKKEKGFSPSPLHSPLKGEGDRGKGFHRKGGLSPSPRSSPLKRKRDFHPHPCPLPSREREIEERVFTGRGDFHPHLGPLPSRERKIKVGGVSRLPCP